jgi:hypothetical protein
MISLRVVSRFFLAGIIAMSWISAHKAAATNGSLRPEIVVADAAAGCPSAEGAFVAVFDSNRGMLLLSAAPFPGGQTAGDARGSSLTVTLQGSSPWNLDHVASRNGQVPLWGARYPFLSRSGSGCVGFDKHRWSSEGDLVTYLRWLVENIYLEIPAEERSPQSGLRLSERQIRLRVERTGFAPMPLTGKEGSTLACRYADNSRMYLFMPFVLDAPKGRLAVRVSYTDGSYFDNADKPSLGWVIASPETPGTLTDPPLTIHVEDVGRSAAQ